MPSAPKNYDILEPIKKVLSEQEFQSANLPEFDKIIQLSPDAILPQSNGTPGKESLPEFSDSWFYVPSNKDAIMEAINEIHHISKTSGHSCAVMDIGSGIGRVLLSFASKTFCRKYIGIEMEAPYVEQAKKYAEQFGYSDKTEFIHADATKFNYKKYFCDNKNLHYFDKIIIYQYVPFTGQLELTFESQILELAMHKPIYFLGSRTRFISGLLNGDQKLDLRKQGNHFGTCNCNACKSGPAELHELKVLEVLNSHTPLKDKLENEKKERDLKYKLEIDIAETARLKYEGVGLPTPSKYLLENISTY